MLQRGGAVILHLLANVQQVTIKPLILAGIALGSLINTDEYTIYDRLPQGGFAHKAVNHSRGECARDEDGDGFCEVHVNTMEGVWGRRLVVAALVAAPAPRHLAGEAALLSCPLRVRSQCQVPGQSPARCPLGGPAAHHPETRIERQ
jgi:ISXO2 transposase-like protein